MEIPGNPWLLGVAVLAALAIVALAAKAELRKRATKRRQADDKTLKDFFINLNVEDRKLYAELPNRQARSKWLVENHPDFVQAAERFYPETGVESGAAYHIDIHLIKGATRFTDFAAAVRVLRNTAIAMSLNEYQAMVDVENEGHRKYLEQQKVAEAKRRAEAEARRKQEAAVLAIRKEAAKKHWNSLSKSQKEAFKKAKGPAARKRALATSTNSSVEAFYPFIMATEFSNVSSNHNNSIDYCESSPSSHSGYSSHSDSGSSYSSSDSGSSSSSSCSSDSGGGGGGGGE